MWHQENVNKHSNFWSSKITSDIFIFLACVVNESMSTLNFHAVQSQRIFADALGPCAASPGFKTLLSLLRVCHFPRGDS